MRLDDDGDAAAIRTGERGVLAGRIPGGTVRPRPHDRQRHYLSARRTAKLSLASRVRDLPRERGPGRARERLGLGARAAARLEDGRAVERPRARELDVRADLVDRGVVQ